ADRRWGRGRGRAGPCAYGVGSDLVGGFIREGAAAGKAGGGWGVGAAAVRGVPDRAGGHRAVAGAGRGDGRGVRFRGCGRVLFDVGGVPCGGCDLVRDLAPVREGVGGRQPADRAPGPFRRGARGGLDLRFAPDPTGLLRRHQLRCGPEQHPVPRLSAGYRPRDDAGHLRLRLPRGLRARRPDLGRLAGAGGPRGRRIPLPEAVLEGQAPRPL
ncbi:MAG: hypothetical protein AVDCRST_MAG01-01-600, partial [uncultured Rubrobacteraceae bacterium]